MMMGLTPLTLLLLLEGGHRKAAAAFQDDELWKLAGMSSQAELDRHVDELPIFRTERIERVPGCPDSAVDLVIKQLTIREGDGM